MNHEELIHEYEALHYQLFGQAVNASGMTEDQLAVAVKMMYSMYPAAPSNFSNETSYN